MKIPGVYPFAAALIVLAASTAARAAEEGTVKVLAPWESSGEVYQVEPDLMLFVGTSEGIMYIEGEGGSLDAATFVCPGTREIDTKANTVSGSGRCLINGKRGGVIFAKFTCKGVVGACEGEFTLVGGTGAYEGISGGGQMVVRTALAGLVGVMESGETIGGAAGLAVWPALKYKLP